MIEAWPAVWEGTPTLHRKSPKQGILNKVANVSILIASIQVGLKKRKSAEKLLHCKRSPKLYNKLPSVQFSTIFHSTIEQET